MKKGGYLKSAMKLSSDADMSCGMALVSVFKDLGKYQYPDQKEECLSFIKKTFVDKNVPKDYAEQILQEFEQEPFNKMMSHIFNIVAKGCGMEVI